MLSYTVKRLISIVGCFLSLALTIPSDMIGMQVLLCVCVCVVWGVVWSVPFLGNMYVPPSMSRFLFKAHSLHIGIEPRKRESFKHRFPLHYLFCVFVVSWFLGM